MPNHDSIHSLRVSLTQNGTRTTDPINWYFLYNCVTSAAFQNDPPAALSAVADKAPTNKQAENLRALSAYSVEDCRKFGGFVKAYFQNKGWKNCSGGVNRAKNGGKGRASSKTTKSNAEILAEKFQNWGGTDVLELAKLSALATDGAQFTLLALTDRAKLQGQLDAAAAAARDKREREAQARQADNAERKGVTLQIKQGIKSLTLNDLRKVLTYIEGLTASNA